MSILKGLDIWSENIIQISINILLVRALNIVLGNRIYLGKWLVMLKEVYIKELIPNNFYINESKLNNAREAYSMNNQESLPPILVGIIDKEYALIDGHSRTMAAFEKGLETIIADVYPIEEIEGPIDLYIAIHKKAKKMNLDSIERLKSKVVTNEEHKKLWLEYCKNLMNQLGK